ncbi:MAG: hypothetical protein GTO30_09340, partial [Acidobacteria bacterium]|nr:hypothetical protein [Acidobacteriota bacterium]
MVVYQAVPDSGTELGQFALLESLTDAAQYRAQKGTLKAVQQFFVDATAIDKFLNTEPARKLASRTSIRRRDLDL